MFRGMVVIFIILLFISGVVVGEAEKISLKIEEHVKEKMAEPEVEKWTYYNALYCYWTAKYDRANQLLDGFLEKYGENEKAEYLEGAHYMKAKTVDAQLKAAETKELYRKYLELYPEGKHANKVKQRLAEITINI